MSRLVWIFLAVLISTSLFVACSKDEGGGKKNTNNHHVNSCDWGRVWCDGMACYDRYTHSQVNCSEHVNKDVCHHYNQSQGYWEDVNGRRVDGYANRCYLAGNGYNTSNYNYFNHYNYNTNAGMFPISQEQAENDRCREHYGEGSHVIAIGGQFWCSSPTVWKNGLPPRVKVNHTTYGFPVLIPSCVGMHCQSRCKTRSGNLLWILPWQVTTCF